jgi:hypothetical protein
MRTIKIKQERVVPTGHPKMNQQRTSKIREELSFVSVTNVATLI